MTAFLIAQVNVKDADKFQQYAQESGPTFEPFGGKVLIKGGFKGNIIGNHEPNAAAIITFPTLEKLEAWYDSDDYQRLIPLRDEAADILFSKFVVPSN